MNELASHRAEPCKSNGLIFLKLLTNVLLCSNQPESV